MNTSSSICGLILFLLATMAFAHPHNAPFTFIKHTLKDGRVVYTNIPQKCFKDGILICNQYHPTLGGGQLLAPSNKSSNSILMKEPGEGSK